MILQIVAIYDAALNAFSQPSFVPTIGSAVRSFQDIMSNPESQIAKHPEDFTLQHIGTFDDELGYCTPRMVQTDSGEAVFQKEIIARAIDYVPQPVEA